MKFKVGEMYFQQHCKKWLRYEGSHYQNGNGYWHVFTLKGVTYNELKDEDLDRMFDLDKTRPSEDTSQNQVEDVEWGPK